MIRDASPADLPALRALFARANDAPYDLAAVAEEKCFGHGIAGEPAVRVYGETEGASVTCGKWLRVLIVNREARRKGIGSALLADAERRGVSVIAAEPGNYFMPGVLEAEAGFFRKRRYVETAVTWNLFASTTAPHPNPLPARAGRGDRDRVLTFIEEHFGRIWRFEAAKAFERDEPTLFITEEDGAITGFAAHDVNNRGLGFFGPTGVAKSMRGRGLGCELLRASLADLHRLGYARTVIPWTDALDFYRKCSGAEAAHRFLGFAKQVKGKG
ncbi:MAG TPA: GNAT family N-acetyltransferase [Thermoanaerobaculia bacterium]